MKNIREQIKQLKATLRVTENKATREILKKQIEELEKEI